MAVRTNQAGAEERSGGEEAQLTDDDMSTITDMFEFYPLSKLHAVMTYIGEMIAEREAREREERERAEREEREARATEIEAIRRRIGEAGLTATDLFPDILEQKGPQKRRKRKGTQDTYQKSRKRNPPFAVRYRGPNDQTWTGKGKPPTWLKQLEAEGHSRDEYAVTEG